MSSPVASVAAGGHHGDPGLDPARGCRTPVTSSTTSAATGTASRSESARGGTAKATARGQWLREHADRARVEARALPAVRRRAWSGAMVVLLVAIGAFVAFRALTRDQPEVRPEPIDYLAVGPGCAVGRTHGRLPRRAAGGLASRPGPTPGPPATSRGASTMLTDEDRFVGIRPGGRGARRRWSTPYVDEDAVEGEAVGVANVLAPRWRQFTDDGGDMAYAAEVGGEWVLVYGSAPADDLLRRRVADRRGPLTALRSPRRASIAASSRCRAPSSHSWQIVASLSPRSHRASDSSRVVPPGLEACAPPRPAPRGPPRSSGVGVSGAVSGHRVSVGIGRSGR